MDRACFDHDASHAGHEDSASRNHADDVVAAAASKIALSEYEKKDARTVAATMSAKSRLGMGVYVRQDI